MDYRRETNGLVTFLEHWSFPGIAIGGLLASQILILFTRPSGAEWIWCYSLALVVAAVGVALVFFAKLPLYQQRRFFAFGSRALPEDRRSFYRWGYRCVFLAVALLLCLIMSR